MGKFASTGKKIVRALIKGVVTLVLVVFVYATISSVSPIYDFAAPHKFVGPDIYNPYKNLDTAHCWKRANFHTHTRVEGLSNECDHTPNEVLKAYENLGYNIVTFSNHNEQTSHPKGEVYQSNGYEHGYNLFKFHKLTFGADEVEHFDHLLPIWASQKQFQIELLTDDGDIVQINHPLRTPTLTKSQLEQLSGYKLIELDSGKSTENEYWDWALSAGRYSFGVANDDLHYPDRTSKIAVRCNFLCTPSARYEDILQTLSEGCFYSMRVPDYGKGDWKVKREKNRTLPYIKDIRLHDDEIFIRLSEPASHIKITGQGGTTLAECNDSDFIAYKMTETDTYARATAYFAEGEVIYTNPFARYDASKQANPFCVESPKIDIFLTILFNFLLFAICVAECYLIYRVIKR